jgi:hypothetical protein
VIEPAATLLAWLGGALIVVADGRRGLALGVALAGLGMGVAVWPYAPGLPAGALVIGGAIAALQRLRAGPPGWAIMPPGSTPRLVLCVAGGALGLWIGAGVTSGPGASLRIAVMVVIGLTGARVISTRQPDIALTALAGLALAAAAASGLAPVPVQPVVFFGGALIAAASSFVRFAEPRGA